MGFILAFTIIFYNGHISADPAPPRTYRAFIYSLSGQQLYDYFAEQILVDTATMGPLMKLLLQDKKYREALKACHIKVLKQVYSKEAMRALLLYHPSAFAPYYDYKQEQALKGYAPCMDKALKDYWPSTLPPRYVRLTSNPRRARRSHQPFPARGSDRAPRYV
jgi:hypothetical protein